MRPFMVLPFIRKLQSSTLTWLAYVLSASSVGSRSIIRAPLSKRAPGHPAPANPKQRFCPEIVAVATATLPLSGNPLERPGTSSIQPFDSLLAKHFVTT
jgi:hypothetical protein